jgi:hypothetical protein
MAGAFTHFILCDVAKRKRTAIGPVLYRLLNKYSKFLFLGAASPDLPYLSISGNVKWADVFHYEKTNGTTIGGHAELKRKWPVKTDLDEAILAWFLGYVSHVVADATIHPVVQAIVGLYEENREEHRICEMTQDSLIYSEKKNTDLAYAEFSSILKFCGDSEYFDGVMEFWKTQTMNTYKEKEEEPHPKLWFTTYSQAVDAAEGGSTFVALFRHIGGSYADYIYKPKSEILSDFPDRYKKYYQEVKLPDGKIGSFSKDVFDKAIKNIIDAWTALYGGLTTDIVVANIIRNWYLDTGVDMDLPSNVVTYWA